MCSLRCLPPKLINGIQAYGTVARSSELARQNWLEAQNFLRSGSVAGVLRTESAEDTRVLVQTVKNVQSKAGKLGPLIPDGAPGTSLAAKKSTHRKRSLKKRQDDPSEPDTREFFEQVRLNPWKPQRSLPSRVKLYKRASLPNVYAYDRFAELDSHLAGLQNQIQSAISDLSTVGTTRPIHSEDGLALVMQNGAMFAKFTSQIANQEDSTKFARLVAISELFQTLGMFITAECDPCDSSGPGGAWPKDKFLSYCHPNKTMWNIIRAEGNHARNEIPSAPLMESKYGFTTEFLVKSAVACQNKYGFYTERKFQDPVNITSPCAFTIPVCWCKAKEIQHYMHEKHGFFRKTKGTVEACRHGGGLPI